MVQLTVIANKLNKRLAPVTNFADKSNIIGVVNKGFAFTGEQETNILGKWYRDQNGHYYWGGGLRATPMAAAVAPGVAGNWWINSLNLSSIWNDFQEEGNRANIAILDSGFNAGVPDLAEGVIGSQVFFNSVAGTPVTIDDTFGHGSHCVSLIGGRNKNFITGCAPKSGLLIAKICSQGSVRNFSIMVDAIKWAIEKKADVISISYGGESSNADLEAIINSAVNDHNIMVVASIGDVIPNAANVPCFPALFKNCLAVGATNQRQELSAVTVLNNKTEINAPGENIPGYALGSQPENKTGTSQASAIVAGIAGLIISHHKNLGKKYTVASIKDLIMQNANNVIGNPAQKLIAPDKIFTKI